MTTGASSMLLRAKLLRGLADTSRLAVLECLLHQPRCVSEVVGMTGLSQPNVSNHLACLYDCGLVEREQQGRFVYYRLGDPRVASILDEIEEVVGSIEQKLEDCDKYEEPGLVR